MAEVNELGTKIAERKLEIHRPDGNVEPVIVRIGMPFQVDGDQDYCCPYEISSEIKTKLRGVLGIDSLQALDLVLAAIRADLASLEKKEIGIFKFLGEPGHGF